MARVDYELAWHRLGEYVASKPQHGQRDLLVWMQRVAAECRVPEVELARVLRLYGVEVNALGLTSRDELEALAGGRVSPADDELPGHHEPKGVRDGSRDEGRRAAHVG